MRSADTQTRSAFLRAWRGEIGLYRAAYGLGGFGLLLVSLLPRRRHSLRIRRCRPQLAFVRRRQLG
jgi:hypothetical protein